MSCHYCCCYGRFPGPAKLLRNRFQTTVVTFSCAVFPRHLTPPRKSSLRRKSRNNNKNTKTTIISRTFRVVMHRRAKLVRRRKRVIPLPVYEENNNNWNSYNSRKLSLIFIALKLLFVLCGRDAVPCNWSQTFVFTLTFSSNRKSFWWT